MFHVGHAAQYSKNAGERACKAEGPRCYTCFRPTLLDACHQMLGQFREAATQQRFHDDGGNMAFLQFGVQVVGIYVVARGVLPVYVIELYLYEVPMHLVVHGQHFVEHFFGTVERESQIADTSRFTFLHQEVYHAILDVTGAEGLDATVTDGV